MDQEENQPSEASQPEVQPAVDANPSTDSAAPVESIADLAPQAESAPVNPFASPDVSEPAPVNPVSSEPSPFAVAPQPTAVPPVFATTPAPMPVAKKSHLGLILGLVGGFVGLLVIIGIAGFVWFMNVYVSKADYQAAATAYNALTQTDSDMAAAMSGASVVPNDLDSQADLFNAQAQKMGSLRAIQKDAAVKKAYDAFTPYYKEEVTMIHAVAELLRATDTCSNIGSTATVSTCVSELRAVKDKGSDAVTAYADSFADYVEASAAGKTASYASAEADFEKATKDLQKKVEDSSIVLRDAINAKLK